MRGKGDSPFKGSLFLAYSHLFLFSFGGTVGQVIGHPVTFDHFFQLTLTIGSQIIPTDYRPACNSRE
jgi:hypothetical protein